MFREWTIHFFPPSSSLFAVLVQFHTFLLLILWCYRCCCCCVLIDLLSFLSRRELFNERKKEDSPSNRLIFPSSHCFYFFFRFLFCFCFVGWHFLAHNQPVPISIFIESCSPSHCTLISDKTVYSFYVISPIAFHKTFDWTIASCI